MRRRGLDLVRAPSGAHGRVDGAGRRRAERYLDAAGWRVRYVRAGSGPPLVLLHGFASSIYTWSETLPALAAQHDVIALDFPGLRGHRDAPDADGRRSRARGAGA